MGREFAENVTHELNTPLTAIRGFVETLQQQKETDNPEQTERFLQIIARHVDRLNRLIDDLMSLSRIEQEKQIHPKPARLKAVLHQAVQICGARAREKDIQIHLDCPDDLEASVDSNLIEQAVVNLLDNAVAYSDQGSEIRIEAVSDDTNVIVRCKDRGIGIEKKHLPRIFERFYRVEKARSRKMGGTGLGLAIVKHIARAHGGRVTVESALGQGSIFSIYLPRRI
jgi:two-component system phosphate regulon sensor histidine kinase PhoR